MSSKTANRWFRINLWLHRWTSLIATIPFLILCLTGTVLIFHEEIDHLMGVVPEAQAAAEEGSKSGAIQTVLNAFPDERVMSTGVDPEDHPGVQLVLTTPLEDTGFDNARFRFVDLATGELIGQADPAKTLTGFLLELHSQWFLGLPGELIGALVALLVLISLLSGLVVYAPYVKRLAFGVLRRGKGSRLLQLDLHNFIGMVVLGWALVVSVTGLLLGFSTMATGIWRATELADLHARYEHLPPVDRRQPPLNIDRVYEVAGSAAPGWNVNTVVFPDTTFSTPRHYTVLLEGTEGIEQKLFIVAAVDAVTGELSAVLEFPAYLKAILISQPLHFGDYGGLPLKILWTACTWLTLFITANGAWLWWRRRQPRVAGKSLEATA